VKIHQLNLQYLPHQDRLLARVNTSTGLEFRLWLTRRLTLGLLPVLRKVSAEQLERSLEAEPQESGLAAKDPKVRGFLSEFKKEQTLREADFATPYKAPDPALPVEEPLLVTEAHLTPLVGGNVEIRFGARSEEPGRKREVKLALDQKLMQGLLHLLEKAFAESQWTQVKGAGAEAEESADKPVDVARPQYLN
jgi:hypothetical protein